MNKNGQIFLNTVRRYSNPKIGFIFIFLIILQYILVPLIPTEFNSEADYYRFTDYSYLYVTFSYTLIVLGIIIFQAHGLEIFTDHFSLWLIIFTCIVRYSMRGNHELIYALYLGFLGLVLSIYVITNRKKIRMPDGNVVIVGLLWSVGTIIILTLVQAWSDSGNLTTLPPDLTNYIIGSFLFNISFGTVIEECYFRGLIVGFLIMNGYKENTAFFVQAILFWAIHYMRIAANPIWFFIGIPLLALSTTLIMKKYKMIFAPIMVHTLANVFVGVTVLLVD